MLYFCIGKKRQKRKTDGKKNKTYVKKFLIMPLNLKSELILVSNKAVLDYDNHLAWS